jgi:membrane-associated phospholipid phosphatase
LGIGSEVKGRELNTTYLWRVATHLGSASLLLPVLIMVTTGLWRSNQKEAVRIWLQSISLAIAITLTTKILFLGWGLGIPSIDFTGISGHTVLATSVLPIVFSSALVFGKNRISIAGVAIGLLLAFGVGISRIVLGAHTLSEVLFAWVLGVMVFCLVLKAMKEPFQRPWIAGLAPLVLLAAFSTTTSNYMPTHDWEIKLSLLLSGQSKPYSRHRLTTQTGVWESSVSQNASI